MCSLQDFFFLCAALATLKPQAGLVAPQAVPASQPAAAVSDRLLMPVDNILIRNDHCKILTYLLLTISYLYFRVLVESLWRLVNRWEWPQRSSRRYGFFVPHCINHYSYKLSIYLSVCLFSVCSFKTKLPSSLQKERRYYTALLLCYIIYNCCDTVLYNVTLLELFYFFLPERKNCARRAG